MTKNFIKLGDAVCRHVPGATAMEFVTVDGEPYVCLRHVDALDPFFISVVSDSDQWLFVSSESAFTAGRVDADHALFPYQTVDKILRHPDTSGALTVFLVERGGQWSLWEPWRASGRVYRLSRHLYKHIHGTSLIFEETNEDLGLRFCWSLSAGEPYGFVRQCRLENLTGAPVTVRYLDGWHQLLPPGIGQETYTQFSNLASAYARHDYVAEQRLGIYTLNAGISDRAEACESLRAACAWSVGHPQPVVLLCDRQVAAFRRGESVHAETEVRAEFGAYLAADQVTLPARGTHGWFTVADTNLDHAGVVHLCNVLRDTSRFAAALQESVAANRANLRRRIAAADGLQQTADPVVAVHHFANVLFNCMRGGTLNDSYSFPGADFAAFVRTRNTRLAARHRDWLAALPATWTLEQLRDEAVRKGDGQLARLAQEYLPLTFSRRHGDPSRPWNRFNIHIKDDHGQPVYAYQGNWRDIFQNWESLAQSYPALLSSMITIFLNASTADGYNPYRIGRDGVDWEVDDPKHPWSHIGYWGDHQIIYLLRLLESHERFFPGQLAGQLGRQAYAYAHVPYEIKGFDALVADPRHSITFNHALHETLQARAAELGGDGKLLTDSAGEIRLVSLAEKLLVPLLVKFTNFVPDGGIWLNTQRPEWNDANNALAGWGLSVVTVCYLRRYLIFLDRLLAAAGQDTVPVSAPVATLLEQVTAALTQSGRFQTMTALGRAGEAHRRAIYQKGLDGQTTLPVKAIRAFVAAALPVIEATIRANRRDDGLYHSYSVLQLADGKAAVKHLYPMLEGQVAVLSAGLLTPAETLTVLQALRVSALYRADQHSYLLYPDRALPIFLERNTLRGPPPVTDRSLFVSDENGQWHFHADLRNDADLHARLDKLGADPATRQAVLELWERIFRHSEFTGRSGTFFAFEGLGSIYWHMVAKLLLAVQECHSQAIREGADPAVVSALASAYDEVRDGLGFRKTPAVYGAFPSDPYSHTPRHRGAQQPGMTGQVKEEILTRWGELGLQIERGCLRFAPRLLHRSEFFGEPHRFAYIDVRGREQTWEMPANTLGFTYCQVPVCYQLADAPSITIERPDNPPQKISAEELGAADSHAILARAGSVLRLTVEVARTRLTPWGIGR